MRKLPWILFALGISAGAVLFFPFHVFTSQIEQTLTKQGIDARLGDLKLSTGLGLGIGKGGLLALKGSNVSLNLPNGRTLTCKEFVLSPHALALFIGRARVAASCKTEREGSLLSVISGVPVWNPSSLEGSVYIQELKLSLLENLFRLDSLSGVLNGKVQFEMPISKGGPRLPAVTWEASGSKVTLPSVSSDMLSFPSISVGKLSTKGKLTSTGRAEIDELIIGDKSAPIEASLTGNFTMDRRGMPTGADIRGRLRTDPEFERVQLKDIRLDLLFGNTKESGQREFHKVAQGNLFGLLLNPPLDN